MSSTYELYPFTPHPFHEVKEGVFPSIIGEEAYNSWIRKLERTEDVTVSRIHYQSHNHEVTGLVIKPTHARIQGHPLILFNRGGRRRYGMLNVLTINNLLTPLVQQGYIVAASNYRGVDGGTGEDEFGGSEVQDILTLTEIARTFPEWDGRNLYYFGWSRGGMMTLLALKHGGKVNAVSLGAPLVDLTLSTGEGNQDEAWLMRALPDYQAKGFAALESRSAPYWISKLRKTPMLIMHGDADIDVSILHSRQLAAKLKQANHPHQLIEYSGGNHYLNQQRAEVLLETVNWFKKHQH
jgi:dipeptidyl aminopeptidase/acylaminoacyl peptidase